MNDTKVNSLKKILLVDDDDSIRWVLNELLVDLGYQVTQAVSAEQAIQLLKSSLFDLLISDVRMPGQSGMDLMAHVQQHYSGMPTIIMTAHSDLESAVQAYQKGAFEYLPKPFDLDEVAATVGRALAAISPPQNKTTSTKPAVHYSIIGESPAMQNLYRAIGRLSGSHMTILLQGESGTGKELVAKALHHNSPRKNSPFIALNMAALPKDLIESELFGHEKGAFTGAQNRYLGRFEQANQGTLFLDEIGDMPLETQSRLLRVLSEGSFYRLGANQPTQVDVRFIAATHQDLTTKVAKGEFREDLYHRLNVIPIQLPALKERTGDIALLTNYFFSSIAKELDEPEKILTDDALNLLQNYQWPGNVRQLENVCRRICVMANSQVISAHDIPEEISGNSQEVKSDLSWQNRMSNNLLNELQKGNEQSLISIQSEIEKLLIKTALKATSGKKAEAAKLLGWGRNTLTRKLKN